MNEIKDTTPQSNVNREWLYTSPYMGLPVARPGVASESFNSLRNYLNPDERIEILKFKIEQRKAVMKTLKNETSIRQDMDFVEGWEREMALLGNPDYRDAEARRLLAHRAWYIDKLTPDDRVMIEKDNKELLKLLKPEPSVRVLTRKVNPDQVVLPGFAA